MAEKLVLLKDDDIWQEFASEAESILKQIDVAQAVEVCSLGNWFLVFVIIDIINFHAAVSLVCQWKNVLTADSVGCLRPRLSPPDAMYLLTNVTVLSQGRKCNEP